MVRLTGPNLAAQASGSLAGLLTFSKSKGRSYAKIKSSPKQPDTIYQHAMKVALGALSSDWTSLTPADKQTWAPLAIPRGITLPNAYIARNTARVRMGDGPTMAYPADPQFPGPAGGIPSAKTVGRMIRITWTFTVTTNLWYYFIYRVPAPADPITWHRIIGMVNVASPATFNFDDRQPVPGDNHYRMAMSTRDGLLFPPWWAVTHFFP